MKLKLHRSHATNAHGLKGEKKMKTKETIETHLDDLKFGLFDKDVFTPSADFENGELATELKCSKELVQSLEFTFSILKEYLGEDLREIWKKLEYLEKEIEK